MNPLTALVQENQRLARRITRLLSLLVAGFFLSLILFNEDVRTDPTGPFFFYGFAVLALLLAWRWEKTAGLLSVIISLLFGLYVLVNSLVQNEMSVGATVIGAMLLILPLVLVGWLFYTLGQYSERLAETGNE